MSAAALVLLHARLLLRMLGLHALRLLRVTLFHLLLLRIIRLTLLRLLVFPVLLLLQLLVIRILLRSQLLLLLLIFRIGFRIARIRRSELMLLHLVRVVVRSLPGIVRRTVTLISARRIRRWRMILATRLTRGYRAGFEIIRTLRRRDRRPPLVRRRAKLRISSRRISMLLLRRNGSDVPFARIPLFFRTRACIDAAFAAVKRHARTVVLNNRRAIRIVNDRLVHMEYRGVVEEMVVFPTSAFKSVPEIPESIVNSAIETNVRSPIPSVPKERTAAPSPPARRPQKSRFRRQHPRARHPVVAVCIVISPITRRPQITVAR